jgi:YccS/YhfK family integral membrane protein
MQGQAKEIKYFLYSQAFADGLRATLAILAPALLGYFFGYFTIGISISLGAMCVSLTDAPGPIIHRRNGLLLCCLFVFLVALITPLARLNLYTMGLEIALVCFFFSMFNVYGSRASSVGNAAILVMILTMEDVVMPKDIFINALFIFAGGLFYTAFSLLLHTIRPYRIAQRSLGDCIRQIAAYLSIKANFYDVETSLEENYRKMVAQQIVVNEKQDAVRELFFKTRQIVKETTYEGRRLVFTFVKAVDLFEDITATFYDYASIRQQYEGSGALKAINKTLNSIAFELDTIGFAMQTNTQFRRTMDYDEEIKQLKAKIDTFAPKGEMNTLILRKILVNLRNMLQGMNDMVEYFNRSTKPKKSDLDHSHFVSHQSLDPKLIVNNLSFQSTIFRHAMRVAIACVAGFAASKLISYGHHSYWILMTIAFMLKPAFSLTKERNVQRILGTVAGGLIGVLILVFIPNTTVLFVLMLLFMIGTYSFMRINYLVMVIFTTPYVLILFAFLGTGFKTVAEERVFDTLLGCAIAFTAGYLLFPQWESDQLKKYMNGIVKANAMYLQKIIEALHGKRISMLQYKLARKEVYLNSANLSAAFQRMLSEPRSKQKNEKHIHQFVVLNHILFSNIASVASTLLAARDEAHPAEQRHLAKKAFSALSETSKLFGDQVEAATIRTTDIVEKQVSAGDDELMNDQLNFIYKISTDIYKTTKVLTAPSASEAPVHIPLVQVR